MGQPVYRPCFPASCEEKEHFCLISSYQSDCPTKLTCPLFHRLLRVLVHLCLAFPCLSQRVSGSPTTTSAPLALVNIFIREHLQSVGWCYGEMVSWSSLPSGKEDSYTYKTKQNSTGYHCQLENMQNMFQKRKGAFFLLGGSLKVGSKNPALQN